MRFPPLGSEAVLYGRGEEISETVSTVLRQDSCGGYTFDALRSNPVYYSFFFYYYLGPLLPLSRYSGHRRSEVVPSTVKGKSKASLDHHSLLLTIGIGACTYPLN